MDLQREFDRQTGVMIEKGYAEVAGLTQEEFIVRVSPLKVRLSSVPSGGAVERIPFVLVLQSAGIGPEETIQRVRLKSKSGFTTMDPDDIARFRPIDGLCVPDTFAYLLTGIETGRETLNVSPSDALPVITDAGRSPLTLEEGIAVITQYPEILRTRNCFSMLGSRCGDRRVTALWVSQGRPRLGWCWAGNPHTWLGSASCSERVAAPQLVPVN